jgi:hypothetical protein
MLPTTGDTRIALASKSPEQGSKTSIVPDHPRKTTAL